MKSSERRKHQVKENNIIDKCLCCDAVFSYPVFIASITW